MSEEDKIRAELNRVANASALAAASGVSCYFVDSICDNGGSVRNVGLNYDSDSHSVVVMIQHSELDIAFRSVLFKEYHQKAAAVEKSMKAAMALFGIQCKSDVIQRCDFGETQSSFIIGAV